MEQLKNNDVPPGDFDALSRLFFFSMRPVTIDAAPHEIPDIWYVEREGEGWGPPVNLGPLVNTEGEEGTPALSPDGRLLFFSRDGDIYYIGVESVEAL